MSFFLHTSVLFEIKEFKKDFKTLIEKVSAHIEKIADILQNYETTPQLLSWNQDNQPYYNEKQDIKQSKVIYNQIEDYEEKKDIYIYIHSRYTTKIRVDIAERISKTIPSSRSY